MHITEASEGVQMTESDIHLPKHKYGSFLQFINFNSTSHHSRVGAEMGHYILDLK